MRRRLRGPCRAGRHRPGAKRADLRSGTVALRTADAELRSMSRPISIQTRGYPPIFHCTARALSAPEVLEI
jgi:hypothetical protein